MPKPEVLVEFLRGLKYDPDATRHYEVMSGGFVWSDEIPKDYSDKAADWALRFLIGYRASLIRGKPREELRFVWDTVLAGCPGWPSFHPERSNTALAEELNKNSRRTVKYLDRLSAVFERKKQKGGEPST
jgi:hypothetical protein